MKMEYSTNKETLISQEQSPLNSKKSFFFFSFLFILVVILVMILSSIIFKKNPAAKPVHVYLSSSSGYYCYLTPYPDLCYTSMPSIINTTALQSSPGPIFTASILLAINELTSITKALSIHHDFMDNPILAPRFSTCQKLVHESQSRLNESLATFEDDSDMESLDLDEYGEMARKSVGDCLLALDENYDMVMSEDEKKRVEEVKMGVEKANKHIMNCIWLFDGRKSILSDFYNPVYEYDQYEYYSYYYNLFEYRILILLYLAMYMFLALLYFLFWRGH